MKNLVVYYTKSGNTETVAQEISKAVGGELKRIELTKEISFGRAAISSLMGLEGKIKPVDFNVKDYDNIFIGSPIWAGKISTPINAFLHETDFTGKNVFVFITQGNDKAPSAVYESIAKYVEGKGGKVADTFFIQTGMRNPVTAEQAGEQVSEWLDKNNFFSGV